MNLRNVTELDLLRALSAPCASLGKDGTVPDRQVTGQVTDVLEFASAAGFPAAGTKGKYYVDKSAGKAYEWNGTGYAEVADAPEFIVKPQGAVGPTGPRGATGPAGPVTAPVAPEYAVSSAEGEYADASRTRQALAGKRGLTDRVFVRQDEHGAWDFSPWQALIPGEYRIVKEEGSPPYAQRRDGDDAPWEGVGTGLFTTPEHTVFIFKFLDDLRFTDIAATPVVRGTRDSLALASETAAAPMSVTWSELAELRSRGDLSPGAQYRITDYVATTNGDMSSRSANHRFDIIVTADDERTLNEKARAIPHEGDTYFTTAGANLAAWEVWYCLDNDTNRFAWALAAGATDSQTGTTGRGVVYRLIDEWRNDIPYDFKGIQFLAYGDSDDVYHYTFDSLANGDASLMGGSKSIYDNKICSNRESESNRYQLTQIVFKNAYYCYSNTFGYNCYSNTFGYNCYSNTFGEYCGYNAFGNDCFYNTFGDGCGHNTFGDDCSSNTFGNSCSSNTFGDDCSYNIFGEGVYYNTFGYGCNSNSLGNGCNSNSLGNGCNSNSLGNDCSSNTFGNDCSSNTFGNGCSSNTFGDDCSYNTFGYNCYSNTFGEYCGYNAFGNDCFYNTFGDGCSSNVFRDNCYFNTFMHDCSSNTFGNSCSYNTFGDYCGYNTFCNNCFYNIFGHVWRSFSTATQYAVGDYVNRNNIFYKCTVGHQGAWNASHFTEESPALSYYRYITLESGVQYIALDCTATRGTGVCYQNVTVAKGVSGTSSAPKRIADSRYNQDYKTTYQPANSLVIDV